MDSKRDRATKTSSNHRSIFYDTFLMETRPCPSLLRYCFSKVVSTSASEHRADVRTTVPAVQVRGDSFGARRGSLLAQLGPHGLPE